MGNERAKRRNHGAYARSGIAQANKPPVRPELQPRPKREPPPLGAAVLRRRKQGPRRRGRGARTCGRAALPAARRILLRVEGGGDVCESNTPKTFCVSRNGFEGRGAHQEPIRLRGDTVSCRRLLIVLQVGRDTTRAFLSAELFPEIQGMPSVRTGETEVRFAIEKRSAARFAQGTSGLMRRALGRRRALRRRTEGYRAGRSERLTR
jgi:hypothetical protein